MPFKSTRANLVVGLYEDPDKGGDAIGKIKKDLGAPSDGDIEGLKAENE